MFACKCRKISRNYWPTGTIVKSQIWKIYQFHVISNYLVPQFERECHRRLWFLVFVLLFKNKKMECVMGFAPLIVPRIFFHNLFFFLFLFFFQADLWIEREEAHTQSISKDQGFEDSIAFFKTTLKTIIMIIWESLQYSPLHILLLFLQ